MLDPKIITSKKFEKATFGYKPEEVDEFLKEIAISYAAIVKENEGSEDKIVKLVDRINQYREDEDAIKDALLGAQKQGNRIISEAKSEAERILGEAKAEAEKLVDDAKSKTENIINNERSRVDSVIKEEKERLNKFIETAKSQRNIESNKLTKLKAEITAFKAQLTDLYNRQLKLIMELPELSEDDIAKMVAEKEAAAKAELNAEAEVQKDQTPTESQEKIEPKKEFVFSGNSYKPGEFSKEDLKFGQHNNN